VTPKRRAIELRAAGAGPTRARARAAKAAEVTSRAPRRAAVGGARVRASPPPGRPAPGRAGLARVPLGARDAARPLQPPRPRAASRRRGGRGGSGPRPKARLAAISQPLPAAPLLGMLGPDPSHNLVPEIPVSCESRRLVVVPICSQTLSKAPQASQTTSRLSRGSCGHCSACLGRVSGGQMRFRQYAPRCELGRLP
jgi:hypothetical protein